MTSVVCLIATWRDGELLAEAVASAAPHVDAVVVLDGAYYDVIRPPDLQPHSLEAELWAVRLAGGPNCNLYLGDGGWRGEIEKRNVLLELGRACVPDAAGRWALVLDADEILVNGDQLHGYIDRAEGPSWGLPRVEPDGAVWWAHSRLFPLDDFTRYWERSYWLRGAYGAVANLEHEQVTAAPLDRPHIEHRWNLREPWRLEVQRAWGRRLAELDGIAG